VPPSPSGGQLLEGNITSSSGGVMTVSDMNSGAERQDAIRNAPSRVRCEREVSTPAPTQLPRGLWCYCADQNAVAFLGGPTRQKAPTGNGGGA